MKCSNTSCGWQGQCNFCQSCGNKMMPFAQEEIFITCSGTLDGKVCGSKLKRSQKFCTKCGTRIDKSLFASQQEMCNECGTILNADFSFCQECGLKRGSVVRLDSHGKEKQSKNTSASDEKPVSPIEKKSHTSSLNVNQSNTLPLDPNGIEVSTEGASANEQDERRVGDITSENAHVSSSNDDVITAFSDESVENVHSQLGYSSVLLNESNEDATFTQDGKSVEDEASDKARAVCSDASAIFDGGGDSISVENPSFHTQIVDPMYDTWTATVENSSQRVNEQKDDHVTCSYASAKSGEEGDSHNIENVQSSCGTLDVVTMTDEGKEDVNTNDEQESEKTVLGKQIIEGDKEREGRSILKTTVETPAINGVETDENANIESNGAASNETDLSQTEDNSDLKQMLDTCDQETQSLEAQSLDYSCDKSGRDEKTKENIAHKRKHEDNRGSSKAKSIKKRDRKNRSHADKFSLSTQVRRQKKAGLKKNCNAATEAGTEIVSDGKEEESSLGKGHNDDLSKISTENADFVFGPVNRNVNNQRYSDIVEKYSVINPPDPSKPSFFQQPEITKISQETKDRTNCENKLDETSTSNGKILSDEQKRPNLESDVRQHMETDGETKVEKKTKQTKTTKISPKCNVGTEGENKPDGTSASNGKTLTEEGKRTNLKTDGRQPTELDNNSNEKTRLEKETKQPGSNEISQKSNVGTNCEIKPDETSASNGKTLSAEEKVLSLESDGRQPAETDKNSNGETKLEKETKNQTEKAHTGDDTRAHANNETDGQRSPFSSIGDGIDVVFHILIPTSIISNSEKVFLIVGLKEYGGWKSRQNELHLVRSYMQCAFRQKN